MMPRSGTGQPARSVMDGAEHDARLAGSGANPPRDAQRDRARYALA